MSNKGHAGTEQRLQLVRQKEWNADANVHHSGVVDADLILRLSHLSHSLSDCLLCIRGRAVGRREPTYVFGHGGGFQSVEVKKC